MNTSPATVQDFLRDLRQRMPGTMPETPLPSASTSELREVATGDDPVARFRISAEGAGCRVYLSNDQDWLATVRRIVADRAAHTVLIEPQPGTALTVQRAAALGAALEADGITTTQERTDDVLFRVDIGITGAAAAVAETSTLMCVSSAAAARGATLIPPIHIALVEESRIVPDLFDLFAQLGADPDLPAAMSLITGPSKTADIEGVLVTGVHGPGEVHIVIM
jgi:L-lactate dehydrogenase complex protein LldG